MAVFIEAAQHLLFSRGSDYSKADSVSLGSPLFQNNSAMAPVRCHRCHLLPVVPKVICHVIYATQREQLFFSVSL